MAERRGERDAVRPVERGHPQAEAVATVRAAAQLAPVAESLHAVAIPGETATLPAEDTAAAAAEAGIPATVSDSVADALDDIMSRERAARVLICGSLYLAGAVLRENG